MTSEERGVHLDGLKVKELGQFIQHEIDVYSRKVAKEQGRME